MSPGPKNLVLHCGPTFSLGDLGPMPQGMGLNTFRSEKTQSARRHDSPQATARRNMIIKHLKEIR